MVPAVPRMVFFLMDNEDAVPAGVRFESARPLTGLLQREHGTLYLYCPHDHGVTSSERLLDDHMPLRLEGVDEKAASELLESEVEVTGTHRRHEVHADRLEPRRGGAVGLSR